MNKIRNPIIPNREPPLVMRTMNANMATITSTGMTPAIPFFTTFLPALLLENRPRVFFVNLYRKKAYISVLAEWVDME